MAFFLEEELLVAGNSFRESIGFLIWSIERSHHDRVDACHTSREGLCLAAEKIHMSIVDSLVEARCSCANHHLRAVEVFGLILLYYLGPKHTCGTEFGNFHEEIGRNAHVELNA